MTTSIACGGDDDDDMGGMDSTVVEPPTTGDYHHFVTTELLLPTTETSQDYALDLDNDGKENFRLNGVLGILTSQGAGGLSIQSNIDTFIMEGTFILLHSIRADALTNDTSVSWQVYKGANTATPPDYTANPMLAVAADSPTDAILYGTLSAGTYEGGPAQKVVLPIPVQPGAEPLDLELYGVRIKGDLAETCNQAGDGADPVILAGGVRKDDLETKLLPEILMLANTTIAESGCATGGAPVANVDACGCTTGSGEQILSLLDGMGPDGIFNCQVDLDEVLEGPYKSFFAPDTDLFTGETFMPGAELADAPANMQTATFDSLGFGVAIRCAPATFTADGEE